MARIAGRDLNDADKVDYALTKIKGVGWSSSREVLSSLKIETTKRVKDLTPDEIAAIASLLDEKYQVEGELIREVRGNIQRLKQIGSYRGMMHQRNLPVRGQRTKSNARTNRGKRRTVGTFKKEALVKTQPSEKEKGGES